MKFYLIYIILSFSFLSGFGQKSKYLDSLVSLSKHSSTPYRIKIDALEELSDYFSNRDTSKGFFYAQSIINLAKKEGDRRGSGIGYFRMAGVYFESNLLNKSLDHYQKAFDYLQNDTSRLAQMRLASIWYIRGAIYQREGDSEAFLDNLLKYVVPIRNEIKDYQGVGKAYHAIALVMLGVKKYDDALKYNQMAIHILEKEKHCPELIDSYSSSVESAYLSNSTFKDSLWMNLKNKLSSADSLLKKYPDIYSEVLYFQALGMFEEKGKYNANQALIYYDKARSLAKANKMYQLGARMSYRLFTVLDDQKQYLKALELLNNEWEESLPYLTPKDRALLLLNRSKSYGKIGDNAKAYELLKDYVKLSDSIQQTEIDFKVLNLERKFNTQFKEKEINRLQAVTKSQELLIVKNRLWISLLIVGLLMFGLLIAFLWFFFKKRQEIEIQQKKVIASELAQVKQNQKLKNTEAVMQGQEDERKRWALELHDGLGGRLTGLKMQASKYAMTSEHQSDKQQLDHIVQGLDTSIEELRSIARHLMPMTLVRFGLKAALADFCASLQRDDLKIIIQFYDSQKEIPLSTQLIIYRIFQELITNAVKHAEASNILAQFIQDDTESISITVEDNGKGFVYSETSDSLGIGLGNVFTRVNYLGGDMKVESSIGLGTTIMIELKNL